MIRRWAGPVVIAVVSVAMLVWYGRCRPDVLIDFGRELYIPWRLAAGQVLYADIAYFNGPLSPYLNALALSLLGTSLLTLIVINTLLAAVLLVLLYQLLCFVADRVSATAACVTFATIFGFGNLVDPGNYNFVTPYAHELTHGMVLVVVAIWCVMMYHRRRGLVWWVGAGFALGLAALTKAEVLLAGLVSVCVALALTIRGQTARETVRPLGVFMAMLVLPPIVAFALLCTAMPAGEAWAGTLGTWSWLGHGEVTSLDFYRRNMGVDAPAANLGRLLVATVWYAAIFVPPVLVGLWVGRTQIPRPWVAVGVFALTAALLAWRMSDIAWGNVARPLPLFVVAMIVVVSLSLLRQTKTSGPQIVRLSMMLFGLCLLGKMILYTRVSHYGFALAMPAAMLVVAALGCWIPDWIDRRGGYGGVVKAVALGALLVCVAAHVQKTRRMLGDKTHLVSRGADAFVADARGMAVNLLLEEIGRRIGPGQTLAVLPEGVMVNYLSRRVNPTPYITFVPPEVLMFGEQNMLEAFRDSPPDFIAIVHRSTAEYGYRFFGRDYAKELFAWLHASYEPVHQIGATPLQEDKFGILLLQAKDRPVEPR